MARETIANDQLELILSNIANHTVSGVIAPPGAGKSTTLVRYINQQGAKIFVVEPTVLACENLHRFVGGQVGADKVGYAVEGRVHYQNATLSTLRSGPRPTGPDTEIVYCTGGHMKRIFLDLVREAQKRVTAASTFEDINLRFCDVLMVDEAHSGSIDNDMIMHLYRFLQVHGITQLPRLLLSSATLDITTTPFPTAPQHTIVVPSFPVTIEYHTRTYRPDERELYIDTAKVVIAKHETLPIPPKADGSPGTDSWLVFCAGSQEVEDVMGHLQNQPNLEVLGAYGNLGHEESVKIFNPITPGIRRVIVATNIAEVAITIDHLSGVFDTLTEKYGEESSSGGFRLSLHWLSKSSAEQRKGRTGRQCPGFCYRMIPETSFDELPKSRRHEIHRVPLDSVIIELLDVGISPLHLFSTIDQSRINKATTVLMNLQMYSSSPIVVTEKGRFSTQFPFSVRGSAILYEWIQLRNPEGKAYPIFPALVMISLIEIFGPSYFWYPHVRRGQGEPVDKAAHREQYFAKYDGDNDLIILANLWLDMYDNVVGLPEMRVDRRSLGAYARENSLNNKKLVELCNSLRTSVTTLARLGYSVAIGRFLPSNLLQIMLPLFKSAYSDKIFTRQQIRGGTFYTSVSLQGMYYTFDMSQSVKLPLVKADEIIGLILFERMGPRGNPIRTITLSVPSTGVVVSEPTKPTKSAPKPTPKSTQPRFVRTLPQVTITSSTGAMMRLPPLDLGAEPRFLTPIASTTRSLPIPTFDRLDLSLIPIEPKPLDPNAEPIELDL